MSVNWEVHHRPTRNYLRDFDTLKAAKAWVRSQRPHAEDEFSILRRETYKGKETIKKVLA